MVFDNPESIWHRQCHIQGFFMGILLSTWRLEVKWKPLGIQRIYIIIMILKELFEALNLYVRGCLLWKIRHFCEQ